ncbi:MAG TPA: FHA domain-containing protein [Acidimicrobiia bacterium]|nr:FHA domain-containing protein [Acidimicrobiia bacterium]
MSEAVLTVLKFCFLALLYLFLYRVVRLTVRELRAPALSAQPAAAPAAATPRRERRPEPRTALRLRIIEPAARRGETHTIDREVTVGRGGGCALVLSEDTYVSQLHARLFQQNGEGYVEDLGSTNGTFVNGKQITGVTRLKRGDHVQFGQTVAEVGK